MNFVKLNVFVFPLNDFLLTFMRVIGKKKRMQCGVLII